MLMLLSSSMEEKKLNILERTENLVASPKVATYDLQPEMSACGVTEGLMEALNSGEYDVII